MHNDEGGSVSIINQKGPYRDYNPFTPDTKMEQNIRCKWDLKDHLINDTKLHLGDTTQPSRFYLLYFRAKTRNRFSPELRHSSSGCGSMYRCPSQKKDINLRKIHKHV